MFLPEPLPETDDLQHKALYNWLNRLRDYTQSITPLPGKRHRITRTPAGAIHEGAKAPPRADTGIRSVSLWQMPGVSITQTDPFGNVLGTFTWYGGIGFGPYDDLANFENNPAWQQGDSLFGVESAEGDYGNYETYPYLSNVDAISPGALNFGSPDQPLISPPFSLAFYMIEFPPEFRQLITSYTYATQHMSAAAALDLESNDQEWTQGFFGSIPFDTTTNYNESEGGEPAATDDYQMQVDPPYFPNATLYIGNPNNYRRTDRFFYTDSYFDATIELNPGWVDLNVSGRRWMPAGLVENHLRTPPIYFSAGLCYGLNNVPLTTAGMPGNAWAIPINQDTNYP